MFHSFAPDSVEGISLPHRFTNPFDYRPHPLVELARCELERVIRSCYPEWIAELDGGKMLGVLIVRRAQSDELGFVAAFSGNLCGRTKLPYFVPPIYDLQSGFFTPREEEISLINREIESARSSAQCRCAQQSLAAVEKECAVEIAAHKQRMMEAKILRDELRESGAECDEAALQRESQFLKAELRRLQLLCRERVAKARAEVEGFDNHIAELKSRRAELSAALQRELFERYVLRNGLGEERTILDIFEKELHAMPPAATGECAAPKLLQYAYLNNLIPIAMGEFWWGASPKIEPRYDGEYYAACRGRCKPILEFMLQGLDVEQQSVAPTPERELKLVFEDEALLIFDKPSGLLSVRGADASPSVQSYVEERYPHARVVHRLDMDTSGLLVVAKSLDVYRELQLQFAEREVYKRYVAVVEGIVVAQSGEIELPLRADIENRPRQVVDWEHGKAALTHFEVVERMAQRTRLNLYPHTGRTHQLRMHAAHAEGLNTPIVGDRLYGHPAKRLLLHAEQIEFCHTTRNERVSFISLAEF